MDPGHAWNVALRLAAEMLDGKARRIVAANSHRGRPHKRAAEDRDLLTGLAEDLWSLRGRDPAEFVAGEPAAREWERRWAGGDDGKGRARG